MHSTLSFLQRMQGVVVPGNTCTVTPMDRVAVEAGGVGTGGVGGDVGDGEGVPDCENNSTPE